MNIKYDREMTLEGNNTVVTEMNKRIQEESCVNGDPYEAAISWEEFFMGIAILSKKDLDIMTRDQTRQLSPKHNIQISVTMYS